MPNFQSQSIAGYNGILSVSTDGGVTWLPVGELREVKLKVSTKMMDATSHSSGGFENAKPGNQKWTATVDELAVFSDTGQAALNAAVSAKTRLKFQFDPAGQATGLPRRVGFGFVADWEEAQPNADLVTEQLTLDGDGQLTFSTQ